LEFYLFYITCSLITEGVGTKYTNETRNGIKSGSLWAQAVYDFGINLGKGAIRVVKNGTMAHSGKAMSYGAGITDAFIGKSKYILSETIDAFKGSIKGFAAVGLVSSAASNYIEYDGNIKHAAIGWAVDSLSGVLICVAATGIVAFAVTAIGITAPVWTTGIAVG